MKILIIDDDVALATIFQDALKRGGFTTTHAAEGKEGISKAKTEKPDFILCDQVLPDITGNEILKTLKSDPETKAIPVAMLSNFGQNELVQDAINNGALDYILKYQIEPDELIKKVTELQAQAKKLTPAATTTTTPAT